MIPAAMRIAMALGMVAATLAAGCHRETARAKVGAFVDSQGILSRVHSVAFMPLRNETNYLAVVDAATASVFQAVQARQLFHIEVVPAADPAAADPTPAGGRRVFTLKELARLRQAFGCDAILVGAVNQFHPYPQMRMGIYLRLIDLRDGSVLWAVDHIWDATDQETQERMECYFSKERGEGYDPLQWRVTTVSPAAFRQFVAYEVADTLPKKPKTD